MKPTRILIADDHPAMRIGLADIITASGPGWEICATAADGREAVAKVIALRPDIVIMDYKMPLVNGLEAAAQIKRRVPGVEILMFSGTQSHYILLEIFRSNVRGCLLKSEATDELILALESLRHHHTFRSRLITELYEKIASNGGDIEKLTARELEILRHLADGESSKEIAVSLGIDVKTVDTHRANLLRKLKLGSVAKLVRYAIRHGMVEA